MAPAQTADLLSRFSERGDGRLNAPEQRLHLVGHGNVIAVLLVTGEVRLF